MIRSRYRSRIKMAYAPGQFDDTLTLRIDIWRQKFARNIIALVSKHLFSEELFLEELVFLLQQATYRAEWQNRKWCQQAAQGDIKTVTQPTPHWLHRPRMEAGFAVKRMQSRSQLLRKLKN